MPNYKASTASFIYEGFTKVTGSQVLVLLYGDTANVVGKSFKKYQDGVAYVVPAGKTFTIMGMEYLTATSARVVTIYQSDDVDASTNPVNKFVWQNGAGSTTKKIPFLHLPSFLSGKYVNWSVDNTSGAGTIKFIYGYET